MIDKVYIVVNETYRSESAFSSPLKAAEWYYRDELTESKDGTIELFDEIIVPLEEELARMTSDDADYPAIVALKIDDIDAGVVDT